MTRHIRLSPALAAVIVWLLSMPATVSAQGGSLDDNILYPHRPVPLFVGADIGYARWDADASFVVGDQGRACAAFADGDGAGITTGLRSFIYLTHWIALSPRLRFEPRRLSFATTLEPEPVRDTRDSVVMLTREGKAEAIYTTFSLDLRLALDLFASGFYLAAGPSASMIADATYDYTERITGPAGLVHGDSRGGEQTLASDRAFDRRESIVFDARGGAGYLLAIGPIVINPEISYTYPLTSALSSPDTLKQRGFSASIGVMYNFGEER